MGIATRFARGKLTKGVEQRVEELADRPMGFNRLHTSIAPIRDHRNRCRVGYPSVQKMWSTYNALIARFGDEYTVLIDAPKEEISKTVDSRIAEAIIRVRGGRVRLYRATTAFTASSFCLRKKRGKNP